VLKIGALKGGGTIGPWFVIMIGSLSCILFVVLPYYDSIFYTMGLDAITLSSPSLV